MFNGKTLLVRMFLAAVITGVFASSPVLPVDLAAASSSAPINHVFLVVMENHSYSSVWNKSSTSYTTSLANSYSSTTNYYAITHPSLPNYLDLFAGSNYGITNDCSPSASCHINSANLADLLEARGLSWRAYMESMQSTCGLKKSGKYAPKHNPFVYFDDIANNTARCDAGVVPFTALKNDLASAATTPNFAFITPNECNDMHDCSVKTGDTWLKRHMPVILNSPACTVDTCLLIITWDEGSGKNNNVLTIFAGSGARVGGAASSTFYNHFSLLKTVEYIFGLPALTSEDYAASPMIDLLR